MAGDLDGVPKDQMRESLARHPNAQQITEQNKKFAELLGRAIDDTKLRQWCVEIAAKSMLTVSDGPALVAAAAAVYTFVTAGARAEE